MTEEKLNITNISDGVKILSTEDTKIKKLGEMLGNDSSRSILKLLIDNEMTANQVAQKTGMLLSLVIYHLNKMVDLGIVQISKIEKNQKEHNMKYYKATQFAVIILPSNESEKSKKGKTFHNYLKRIYVFTAIGIASLIPWIVIRPIGHLNGSNKGISAAPQMQMIPAYLFWAATISLGIIVIGLIIVLIKNRKTVDC